MRALFVRCGNTDPEETSCTWRGELGDLEHHQSNCPLERVPCPNKCLQDNEQAKILRKNLETHLTEECPNRQYTCPHCQLKGLYSDLASSHTNECMKIPVKCPNAPCTATITRATLQEHNRSGCLYAIAICKHIGCSTRLKRAELKEHEANMELHLEITRAMVAGLKTQIAQLKEATAKTELKAKREVSVAVDRANSLLHGQTTIRIPDFMLYKNRNKEFKSQPFYSQQRGYKLCVIVEPNGTSKVKGAYMSVFAHLMRGEHDDGLPWPLVGTVTFELLNQLGNHDHRKRSCTFPADDKDNHRVLGQEIADAGYGCPKFISHAKLGIGGGAHDAAKDVQYLKDDTVYLRVAVEAPDPLDYNWLKCY